MYFRLKRCQNDILAKTCKFYGTIFPKVKEYPACSGSNLPSLPFFYLYPPVYIAKHVPTRETLQPSSTGNIVIYTVRFHGFYEPC